MTQQFCYFCKKDTNFIKDKKKLVCSNCKYTESNAKRIVNTERNTKKKKSTEPSSKRPTINQKQRTIVNSYGLPPKPENCVACKSTDFIYQNGWFCNQCGRSESVAKRFINSIENQTKNSLAEKNESFSFLDSTIAYGIVITLVISFFPFILLYLVLTEGLENTIAIVKEFLSQIFRILINLIIFVVLILLVIFIFVRIFKN